MGKLGKNLKTFGILVFHPVKIQNTGNSSCRLRFQNDLSGRFEFGRGFERKWEKRRRRGISEGFQGVTR